MLWKAQIHFVGKLQGSNFENVQTWVVKSEGHALARRSRYVCPSVCTPVWLVHSNSCGNRYNTLYFIKNVFTILRFIWVLIYFKGVHPARVINHRCTFLFQVNRVFYYELCTNSWKRNACLWWLMVVTWRTFPTVPLFYVFHSLNYCASACSYFCNRFLELKLLWCEYRRHENGVWRGKLQERVH
jgi:hypothetical protein